MNTPHFHALYYGDRLHAVNPAGDVGIISLWSPLAATSRRLTQISPDILAPEQSRVAIIANLYGDGMYAMFCNLLFNPQIRHLIALGEHFDQPTSREIEAFLRDGLEDSELFGRRLKRIRGTDRLFPAIAEFDEARLRETLSFRGFGKLADPALDRDLPGYLKSLPRIAPEQLPPPVQVTMPDYESDEYARRPSNIAAQQVERKRPLDCWEELVVRTIRFGQPVELSNGPRLELLNAKAVITEPAVESDAVLSRYGFRLERFLEYQRRIIDPRLPDGISYTYGNRLRGYFREGDSLRDTLALVVKVLQRDPQSRHGYISLWDTANDLPGTAAVGHPSVPCLTTIFFRCMNGRLTLTATYRAHNLLTAWLENVYGLMKIQQLVAEALGLPIGQITVVSHSLGIDPRNRSGYELAQALSEGWKRDEDVDRLTGRPTLREDPNGYFTVRVDAEKGCIVAEHLIDGIVLKQYVSKSAEVIRRAIIGDMGVSLVSHAMWLGHELAVHEHMLHEGRTTRPPRRRPPGKGES
ncbi:thymidylate synthase [Catellatospora aurea]|uniref:Thymidylate synthase n=1 Tax=Catellatospora aurea TaxID=1337874 RepID=A0ABW2GX81_9ACTN